MEKNHEYDRVFKQFDGNGDGKLSALELQLCIGSIVGEITAEEAETVVVLMDSDADGMLGVEDLVRFLEGDVAEEEKAKDMREAFKMYEMDGCGCITPNSLMGMLGRLGVSKTVDDCKAMIAQYDLNGDGVLSFDEFKVMLSS